MTRGAGTAAGSRAEPSTDHDQAARVARIRHAAADVDRVRALARRHTEDPDWAEVVALLDRVALTLGRDLGLPSGR